MGQFRAKRGLFLALAGGFAAGQVVRVAELPVRRIARRAEFGGAEDPPILPGTRHGENQGHPVTGPLKVGDAGAGDATVQGHAALLDLDGVDAVSVDHPFVVDVKLGTIVGGKKETVRAGIVDIEIAAVIDGEPFEAVGDTREAIQKTARRNVEGAGVNRADGFQFLELWKLVGFGAEQVDVAAQAKGIDYGDPQWGDWGGRAGGAVGKRPVW